MVEKSDSADAETSGVVREVGNGHVVDGHTFASQHVDDHTIDRDSHTLGAGHARDTTRHVCRNDAEAALRVGHHDVFTGTLESVSLAVKSPVMRVSGSRACRYKSNKQP